MPLAPPSVPTYPSGQTYWNQTNFIGSSTYGERVDGSDGNDFIYTAGQNDFIDGDYGNDTLWGGTGDDIVYGNTDNDTISGDAGDDWLYGDRGSESRWARGDDYVVGGDGNDYLYGAGGNDELIGGNDKDTIEGGSGNDTLVGGSGADEFRFDVPIESTTLAFTGYEGTDTYTGDIISDFEDEVDMIRLIGVTANDVSIDPEGTGDTRITVTGVDGDLVIFLTGVDSSLINLYDDFIYA